MDITEMAYITRMDYAKTAKGWWVRFVLTNNGDQKTVAQKSFSDSNYIDGKEEGLFFAQEWRDYKYKELIEDGIIRGYQATYGENIPPAYIYPRPDNKSGVVGVERVDFHYLKTIDGRLHPVHTFCWKATWVEYDIHERKPRRRSRGKVFSIRKYGEQIAFDLASEARAKKVQYILSPNHIEIREEYQKQKRRS
jgi:hypothetical protein